MCEGVKMHFRYAYYVECISTRAEKGGVWVLSGFHK